MDAKSGKRSYRVLARGQIHQRLIHARRKRCCAALVWVALVATAQASCAGTSCSPRLLEARTSPQTPRLERSHETAWALRRESGHYFQALQLDAVNDDAPIERKLRNAVNNAPHQDNPVRNLALFYIAGKRYDDAIKVIADYVELRGVTALGFELEAELLFQKQLFDPALEAALGSLKLDANNARMHQLLALIHIAKRKDGAAAVELQKAVELDTSHAGLRYLLGRVLYSTGGYAEARDQFLACLKIDPAYRKARENLGLCYEALEDYSNASQAYQDAIALEESRKGPKHAEPYAFYGAMLAKVGESEKALLVLHQGVAASPRSFVANYHLGRLLLNAGNKAEAEKFLLIAADLDPKFSRTYYLLGNLRQRQNRRAEAARYFAMFKELDSVPENRVFPLTDR